MLRSKTVRSSLFLLLFAITAVSLQPSIATPDGPILWQQEEAILNERYLVDGQFTSYLPPPFEPDEDNTFSPCDAQSPDCGNSTGSNLAAALVKDFPFGPDPRLQRDLLQRESDLLKDSGRQAFGDGEILGQPPRALLGVITIFQPLSGSETFTRTFPIDLANPDLGCSKQSFTYQALDLGDDPPPGQGDNFTFYKHDLTLDDYRSAIFGTGPDAGYDSARADLGGIDLAGYSLNNYLMEMNYPGSYQAGGDVLPASLALPHTHEHYGYARYSENSSGECSASIFSDNNRSGYLSDAIDAMTAEFDGDPGIEWAEFDADGDQIIDLLALIHAGYGYQGGGGIDRLTTSQGRMSTPRQVAGFTTPDESSDDYFVSNYAILPEHLDVGSIQEEFEHQFGIADYYTLDKHNSNSFWTSHSNGVWGGPLGATRPVGSSLHQSWLLGRKSPLVIDYNDIPKSPAGSETAGQIVRLGRARYTPQNTEDGVIIRLPQKQDTLQNRAGSGIGWHSGSGDLLDNRLTRTFDLHAAEAPVTFALDAWWDLETEYDYGLLEISIDYGRTWITPTPLQGSLTDRDPLMRGVVDNNKRWGLTGTGQERLQWDLTPFAGRQVIVRLRYLTDPTTSGAGLFVDNIRLDDAGGALYENDLEVDFSDWTSAGWQVTPTAESYEHYYLLEWRDDNGFDQSLNDPYAKKYASTAVSPPTQIVDRLPATTPSLIIAYRDQSQRFDYNLTDSNLTGDSAGPKFGHLVIDAHPFPQQWDSPDPGRDNLTGKNLDGRVLAGDAGFGLVQGPSWTASLEYDPSTGQAAETKTWESRPPVSAFHDSYTYYPGVFYDPGTRNYYYWHSGASAVLPAKDRYSTRVTDVSGALMTDKFGAIVSGFPLGTGNPGDDHVHYGLHVEVLESSEESGLVRFWKSFYETKLEATVDPLTFVSDTAKMEVAILENIGGKLENPRLVVTLPSNVAYIEGSAGSGFSYMDDGGSRRLEWTGDDIGTRTAVNLGSFLVQRTGVGPAAFKIDLFRDSVNFVQSTTVTAPGQGAYIPLIAN